MIDIAHVHPALVHFPIVLLLLAVALDMAILLRGSDLAARACLSSVAAALLVLGALGAVVAAIFGDMAFDQALAHGFREADLNPHHLLGMATTVYFSILALVRIVVWQRRTPLTGRFALVLLLLGVAGIAMLVLTAYLGGDLVYRLGVNVMPVRPAAPLTAPG